MSSIALIERELAVATTGKSRRTLAVVLAGFCAFLDLHAPQPLLPELARTFHKSPAATSLLISISTLAVALAAPFAGLVADRLGRKRVIVPATLLLAVPTLLAATASSFDQLLFWRFWQGVFTPGIFAITVTYINEQWTEGAGAAMSAYVSGTVLGGFAGRTLAAMVAAHGGWELAFIVLGLLNLIGGLAVWAWLPADRSRRRGSSQLGPAVLLHLRNPRLVATYAAGFCMLFSLLGVFTYLNFYLAGAPFHLTTAQLGLLFAVYLVGAVVTPLAGQLIDRWGHRAAFTMALGAAIMGNVLTLVHSLAAVVCGLSLFATGVFVCQSAASSYIGTVAQGARAVAVGLYVTAYYLGGTVGAAAPGRLWSFGGWPACVALLATVQLATVAVALKFWKPAPACDEAVYI
jgi:predicted MFS family arabinose efflux permease